jgi:acyl-CoA thioesterase FadM
MTAAPDLADPGVVAKELLTVTTTVAARPLFEGNNISYAIGFKHISYLVEAGILAHFRRAGLSAGALFSEYGRCFELVAVSARLGALLGVDDEAELQVTPVVRPGDSSLRFKVGVVVERAGERVTVATAKAEVVLRTAGGDGWARTLPAEVERFVVPRIGGAEPGLAVTARPATGFSAGRGHTGPDPVLDALIGDTNAFGWKWRIPYFYCHFNERLQMSGYLRLMEEVVDLFLADRGLPIKSVLDSKGWIPVVTTSDIRLLDEVEMEEEVYTVYTVEDIFKDLLYKSRFDVYVVRDGRTVHAATGSITHGYLEEVGPNDWAMATFDAGTRAALSGVAS